MIINNNGKIPNQKTGPHNNKIAEIIPIAISFFCNMKKKSNTPKKRQINALFICLDKEMSNGSIAIQIDITNNILLSVTLRNKKGVKTKMKPMIAEKSLTMRLELPNKYIKNALKFTKNTSEERYTLFPFNN